MVLRTLLIPKGQKGVEAEERFVKIEGRREKTAQEASTVRFWCEE